MEYDQELLQTQRYHNDIELVCHIEKTTGMKWRGQLVPSNFNTIEFTSTNNYLYKCPQCPAFGAPQTTISCVRSKTCCDQYYLVFQSKQCCIKQESKTCCTGQPINCSDQSAWFAVDGLLRAQDFCPLKHLLPLQVEQNYVVANLVSNFCAECVSFKRRYAGAAQWRSCATCCPNCPVDTDLVRDSLVRIGKDGSKYWQYKPRARTEADRVHGIFGQSVFRGQGPCGYLPDYKRRSTPVRGGYVPANNAPRAVSAVMAPRLCDDFACRN